MNFEGWNELLSRHFFNPERAGKRVYLHTTNDLLRTLSRDANALNDFVVAIKAGPEGFGSFEMCSKALAVFSDWRERNLAFPPYVAYLCLFALSATREGNWPRHAYYPRLWDVLAENKEGAPRNFRALDSLWRDLEVWTDSDKNGELGLFKYQSSCAWIYVGLPIAQTILTDEERRALPSLFEAADLEPGAALPEAQLAATLAQVSEGRLRRRTTQLMCSSEGSDYKSALMEVIQGELSDWDGSVQAVAADAEGEKRAGLRLWLKEIDPAGFVESRIIGFLPESVEPDELLLRSASVAGQKFECPAQAGRISDALRDAENGNELKAEHLRWETRSEFRCERTGTKLILPAAQIRIFISGGNELGGYVEAKKIPSYGDFFVAAHSSACSRVESCGWENVRIASGLPNGWRLFRANHVEGTNAATILGPAFSRPQVPRIEFRGGVRGGIGTAYFPFALPWVIVDWHAEPTGVKCNNQELQKIAPFEYQLREELIQPVNTIKVDVGEHQLQKMLYVVSDGWNWSEGADCPAINEFGKAEATGIVRIKGAKVEGAAVELFIPDPETVAEDNNCSMLLGRVPGQIADIRHGEPMPDWPVVWAVSMSRRRVVFAFCGSSIESSRPDTSRSTANRKQWAKVIWVNRKITEDPRNRSVRELLRAYREVARGI